MFQQGRTGETYSMNLKIKRLKPTAHIPQYQTSGAAAVDLHACLDKPITIPPMGRMAIPTGIAIELPAGYEAQVRARSGLAIKQGIGVVNGIGTIDCDFRGEINVLLINWGQEDFEITDGMRIAQMVIAQYVTATWQVVDDLSTSDRQHGGFGSTGV